LRKGITGTAAGREQNVQGEEQISSSCYMLGQHLVMNKGPRFFQLQHCLHLLILINFSFAAPPPFQTNSP